MAKKKTAAAKAEKTVKDKKERRRCERYRVSESITTYIGSSQPPYLINSRVIDVSRNGILVGCSFSLAYLLMLKEHTVKVYNFGRDRLESTEARVVRISGDSGAGAYQVGLKFADKIDASTWKNVVIAGGALNPAAASV